MLPRLRLLPTHLAPTMASASHVAVFAPGQAQKLVMGSLLTPTALQPHEMLVDVKAVSVNPVDYKVGAQSLVSFQSAYGPF
jgi:NADPH:quinone reductase-like Zn-dependent oxidoreductase